MMRFLILFFLGTNLWLHGANIFSYVDEEGVTVFTNLQGSKHPDVFSRSETNFVPMIIQLASRYGVNRELIQAIIKVESDFNPMAVSEKNCKGLMQLHPDTAQRFGVEDIFDPAQNIEGGVRYLNYLIEAFGDDLDHVLAAYNAGENAVRKYDGIPPYPETVGYVKKVKKIFGGPLIDQPARNQRIIRLELPDGQVLITNDPAHSLGSFPQSK